MTTFLIVNELILQAKDLIEVIIDFSESTGNVISSRDWHRQNSRVVFGWRLVTRNLYTKNSIFNDFRKYIRIRLSKISGKNGI